MKLTNPFRGLFAADTPKPPTGAAAAALGQHQAIDWLDLVGILQRLPDPDELLRQAGLTRAKLSALTYDPEIGGALETRRDAVVATPHRLDVPDGTEADPNATPETDPRLWVCEEIKEHIEPLLRGAWSAVPYGYSVMEVVYEPRDRGRVGIKWVGEKPMEWFAPMRDGTLLYTSQLDGVPGLVDLNWKFILTQRNATYRQPQGEALLSRAYWLWWFLAQARKGNAGWLEKYAEPLIAASASNPQGVMDSLEKMGYQAAIAVGQNDKVQATLTGFAGEYDKWIARLERAVQKLILGQTGTTDVTGGGSYAAAKVQDGVRDDKLLADLRLVRPAGQSLVDRLWALNRFPGPPPEFVLGEEGGLEMERATRDATLANAGIVKFSDAYLMSAYDLSPEDIVEQPAPPVPTAPGQQPPQLHPPGQDGQQPPQDNQPAAGDGQAKMAAGAPRFTVAQQAVEGLVAAALQESTLGIPVADLRAVIQAAADPADLEARLAVLIASRDKEQMTEALSRALFSAQVLGYVASEGGRS